MKLKEEFYERFKKNELYRAVYRCVDCASCVSEWPEHQKCSLATKYKGIEANARGLNWTIQYLLDGKLLFSPGLIDLLFRCSTCNYCVSVCPAGLEPRSYIESLRRDLVEEGVVPETIKKVLEDTSKYGNVWGKPEEERSRWADGLEIKHISEVKDFDFLLFVDCSSSYVERNQETTRKLVDVLNKAGVKFGFLGNEEKCDGNEVLRMGEEGLFEDLARENITKFKEYGVKKIITLSPHSFHALKNEYSKLDPELKVEVMHYTQFLRDLIKEGRLNLKKNLNIKATYHDPCYLGKHNSIYEEPREVLQAIPGLDFTEMELTREKSVCCGGGGGGLWIERGKGIIMEQVRLRQALDLDVDVLATACPFCTQQLEAAKEDLGETRLEVRDIIELVHEAI
jgi:Fe-S oxidoreductase